jgi:hypothetical protein
MALFEHHDKYDIYYLPEGIYLAIDRLGNWLAKASTIKETAEMAEGVLSCL